MRQMIVRYLRRRFTVIPSPTEISDAWHLWFSRGYATPSESVAALIEDKNR